MSDFTTAEKDVLLDATTITHVAAFDGQPSGAGSEVGSDRGAVSWNAASGGEKTAPTAQVNVPGGNTANWVGYFDAASGGTLRGEDQIPAEVFGGDGVLNVNNIRIHLDNLA